MTSRMRHLLSASALTTVGFGAQKALQLLSNLLLARVLAPHDFGVVAIANVVVIGLAMLSDVGIQQSIYRRKVLSDDYISTAWTLQVIRGVLLSLVACGVAYPVSLVYQNSILWPMLSFIGITSILSGLQTPAVHLYGREIKVLAPTLIRLGGQCAALAAALGIALATRSAWALAVGAVVSAVVELVLGYFLLDRSRPVLKLHRESVHDILTYGRWIFLATLLTYFGGQGMTLIQALLVPLDTLGTLNIAVLLVWPVGELISRILERVAMPALAQGRREGGQDVLRQFLRMRKAALLIGVPAFVAMSVASPYIIELLYDTRYGAAGAYLRVFAANFMLAISATCYGQLVLAEGASRAHFQLNVVATALRLSGLLAGYHVGGVIGMIVGSGVANLIVCATVGALLIRRGVAWQGEAMILLLNGVLAYAMWRA